MSEPLVGEVIDLPSSKSGMLDSVLTLTLVAAIAGLTYLYWSERKTARENLISIVESHAKQRAWWQEQLKSAYAQIPADEPEEVAPKRTRRSRTVEATED